MVRRGSIEIMPDQTFVVVSHARSMHVFTDIQMPGTMDGSALAHHTPKHRPWIGLLVTSRPAQFGVRPRVVRQAIGDALPPKHRYPSGSSRSLIVVG
jgi:hypothetical protein